MRIIQDGIHWRHQENKIEPKIKIVRSFNIPHFFALQVKLILSHPDFIEQK